MPLNESEVKAIRDLLRQFGLGLAPTPAGTQSDEIAQLRQQVANLQQQRNTGNVMGGMIRTEIAPGAYTVGPFRQDLDATYPVSFDLWIPDYLLRIKRCQMRIKPAAVRSSVAVATSDSGQLTSDSGGGSTSGASSTSTTPSGGGSTSGASSATSTQASGSTVSVMTGFTENHRHVVGEWINNGSGLDPARIFSANGVGRVAIEAQNQTNWNTGQKTDDSFSSSSVSASHPTHVHNMAHTHSTPNHSHNIEHTHSTPDHQHTIPAHGHDLTLEIAEGGTASGLEVSIDNIDRTTSLGGPWDAAAVVDITDYLINARLEPVAGAHPIEIRSATVGAVEVWFDFYVVVKAIQ